MSQTRWAPAWPSLPGLAVHISPALPLLPTHIEDARRMVRHGLADVLEWLGEEVGPKPGEATHALRLPDHVVLVSQALYNRIRDDPETLLHHL